MRSLSFTALIFALHLGLAIGAESATQSPLLGSWEVVAVQNHGKDVELDEMAIRFEFTNSQLILRVSERGNVIGETKPSHVYDFKVEGDADVTRLKDSKIRYLNDHRVSVDQIERTQWFFVYVIQTFRQECAFLGWIVFQSSSDGFGCL